MSARAVFYDVTITDAAGVVIGYMDSRTRTRYMLAPEAMPSLMERARGFADEFDVDPTLFTDAAIDRVICRRMAKAMVPTAS